MGLEKVKEDILQKARGEADKLIEQGQTEARNIDKTMEKEFKTKKKEIERAIEQEVQAVMKRALSAAELETKREILNARKELLNEVFEKVRLKLESLPTDKRKEHLAKLMNQAKDELEIASVYCSKKDAGLLSGYKVNAISMNGGLIAENKDGSVRVDLSYDSLLEVIHQDQIKEVSEILFTK